MLLTFIKKCDIIFKWKNYYAPLAQLVEQLTLNQWVLGSSPRWCTNGPLVKRLRLRPLTAATPVRFWYGSPHRNAKIIIFPLCLYGS